LEVYRSDDTNKLLLKRDNEDLFMQDNYKFGKKWQYFYIYFDASLI